MSSIASSLEAYDGKLYFTGRIVDGNVYQMRSYDPATGMVSDVNGALGFATETTAVDGKLYFSTSVDPTIGVELYAYDSATDTTTLVADVNPAQGRSSQPYDLVAYDGDLYFYATTTQPDGTQVTGGLYRTQTDARGGPQTARVLELDLGGRRPGEPYKVIYDDRLFLTSEGGFGELMAYDAATRTVETYDIAPDTQSSRPISFANAGGKLYFSSGVDNLGNVAGVLTRYDPATGAVDSLQMPRSTRFGGASSVTALEGKVYFFDFIDNAVGTALYVYDPSDELIELAYDFAPNSQNSSFSDLTAYDGSLYLRTNDADGNAGLYRFDPDTGQATLTLARAPSVLTVHGGALHFAAPTDTAGTQLYALDSAAGTPSVVTSIRPGVGGTNPTGRSASVGDTLYFFARGPSDRGDRYTLYALGDTLDVFPKVSNLLLVDGRFRQRAVGHDGVLYYVARTSGSGNNGEIYRYAQADGRRRACV